MAINKDTQGTTPAQGTSGSASNPVYLTPQQVTSMGGSYTSPTPSSSSGQKQAYITAGGQVSTDPSVLASPSVPYNSQPDTGTSNPAAANQTNTGQPTAIAPANSTSAANYTGNSIVDALNQGGQPSDFQSRANLAAQAGIQNYTGSADQNTQLLNKYKQGLASIKAGGSAAPDNRGPANQAIQQATNAVNQDSTAPSIIGNIMDTDTSFDSILTAYDKFHSPEAQHASLMDTYKSLSDSLGIQSMNTDLLNAKRIIDGTEDDIRMEVEKAGGFASESQVVALSNARNKSLVKNYNYLLEARDNAMTQLNTMMDLTVQDRQLASAEFDRKMNFAFKVQDYKMKAIDDAREGFNKIIDKVGYDGFLSSMAGNTKAISQAEKIMGVAPGGLKQLSLIPPKIDTQVINYGEGSALINSKTGNVIKTYPGKLNTTQSKVAQEKEAVSRTVPVLQDKYNQIQDMLDSKGYEKVVGTAAPGRTPQGFASLRTGVAQNAVADIHQITAKEFVDTLINAKAAGATFGALTDREGSALRAAATKINDWEIKDDKGNPTGRWDASEDDFRAELEHLQNLTKRAMNGIRGVSADNPLGLSLPVAGIDYPSQDDPLNLGI